jgi:hypothetical protein
MPVSNQYYSGLLLGYCQDTPPTGRVTYDLFPELKISNMKYTVPEEYDEVLQLKDIIVSRIGTLTW